MSAQWIVSGRLIPLGGPPVKLEFGRYVALIGLPERSVGQAIRVWQNSFRSWWFIAKSTKRSDCIIVLSPSFDQDLCLLKYVEDFCVE